MTPQGTYAGDIARRDHNLDRGVGAGQSDGLGLCGQKGRAGGFDPVFGVEHRCHGVRANIIAPGTFLTDMARSLWESRRIRPLPNG